MNVIVTCGPSYEPIDSVRRLTNFSTGSLGIALANALADAGHRVTCLKGAAATCPDPLRVARAMEFTTNDDLAARLAAISAECPVDVVFHPAALCDFKVEEVRDDSGATLNSGKFPTRHGRLWMALTPTIKVLPMMRGWFPRARIVGWKYEVEGSPESVVAAAARQFKESGSDTCIVNGPAWGGGFGWCEKGREVVPLDSNQALLEFLVRWVGAI